MTPEYKQFLDQALASANDCYWTGRPNKAISLLEVVRKTQPDHELIGELYRLIVSDTLSAPRPDLSEHFGINWHGESLRGASIEVFADVNLGNTINFLRYLYALKREWECRIVFNCYQHYETVKDLLDDVWFIDELTQHHVKCDYRTNIMCIPALLSGLKLDNYYPAEMSVLLKTKIPWQPDLEPRGELAVQPKRPACGIYTDGIDEEDLKILKESKWNFYTLPSGEGKLLTPTCSLNDVALLIYHMDAVIATDSAVLHLGGTIGTPTFGLMDEDDNPLWNRTKSSMWYEDVKLFWKNTDSWTETLRRVRDELELIPDISYD